MDRGSERTRGGIERPYCEIERESAKLEDHIVRGRAGEHGERDTWKERERERERDKRQNHIVTHFIRASEGEIDVHGKP